MTAKACLVCGVGPLDIYRPASSETLAHLERGARIAFAALERQSVPLTAEEREWFAAELKRKGET